MAHIHTREKTPNCLVSIVVLNYMKQIILPIVLGILGLVGCNKPYEKKADIVDSKCDINFKQEFLTDTIISQFELELQNENIVSNFLVMIDSTLSTLKKSKKDRSYLWPYSKIDSAHYVMYEPFVNNMAKNNFEEREIKKIIRLCDKKTAALLNLMNNPNYFSYGECGTAIPEALIRVFRGGQEVGTITFACNHKQTSSTPQNNLNKFGGLNEKGHQFLDKIKPWE